MSLSVASWEVPFTFVTQRGTINFNTDVSLTSGNVGQFLLNPGSCEAQIPLRVTDDPIPQADGEITHERFYLGYLMTLAVQLWTGATFACDDDLQEMADLLMTSVRGMARAVSDLPNAESRVYWTPEGSPQRMIRRVLLNEPLTWELIGGGGTEATFQVKSMYPYAWDATEITTSLPDNLINTGTADMWPVIKVFGPTSSFTITNGDVLDAEGNATSIIYSSGNAGGSVVDPGDYIEIDTFRNTMYLNGNGANMKPGLTVMESDFFPIQVGDNNITITGATADVLWQNAWG